MRSVRPYLWQAIEALAADSDLLDGTAWPFEVRRTLLLQMSAATIDRALKMRNPVPGFIEADLVSHSGPNARGSFIQTRL